MLPGPATHAYTGRCLLAKYTGHRLPPAVTHQWATECPDWSLAWWPHAAAYVLVNETQLTPLTAAIRDPTYREVPCAPTPGQWDPGAVEALIETLLHETGTPGSVHVNWYHVEFPVMRVL